VFPSTSQRSSQRFFADWISLLSDLSSTNTVPKTSALRQLSRQTEG